MSMTDAQKLALFEQIMAKKELQKQKDKWYWENQKHQIAEMKRIIKEHGLKDEMRPFDKTVEDFID